MVKRSFCENSKINWGGGGVRLVGVGGIRVNKELKFL